MAKVVVVTDSTAYLPQDLVRRFGIQVAPLSVIWEGKTLRDGVDITPAEFYAKLKTSKTIPTTAQTTPEEFVPISSPDLSGGNSVLGIFISSKLSGTVDLRDAGETNHACRADRNWWTSSVRRWRSVLSPWPRRALVQSNASLAEAAGIARKAAECSSAVFVVDTLEFLHRGGRIGGAKRFLGTALNLKLLLECCGTARWKPSRACEPRAKPRNGCWI